MRVSAPDGGQDRWSVTVDSALATWIIGGMALGYVGLAGYIVKLHATIHQMLRERLKSAEDKLALLELLKQHGGHPPGGQHS